MRLSNILIASLIPMRRFAQTRSASAQVGVTPLLCPTVGYLTCAADYRTLNMVCGITPYIGEGYMAQAATKRSQRLDARVTLEEKEIIETAARLRGTSITDFLVMSAKEAAVRTIRESEVLILAGRSRKIFVEALLNPPNPSEKALAAAKRFKREIG